MALGFPEEDILKFNSDLSLLRIINDIQTDFIYAPHINIIYQSAGSELYTKLESKLLASGLEIALPISMEVPKPSGFSRPGTILYPKERLLYQMMVDSIAQVAEKEIDRNCVFSQKLLATDPDGFMFEPSSTCYQGYRDKITGLCKSGDFEFVLKADIASFFQNLSQHNLVNLLSSSGCDNEVVKLLERFMSFQTEKISSGIVQGVYPSDFLGNFYLCSIDGVLAMNDMSYARYVDDICIFFKTENQAKSFVIYLNQLLRKEGLDLNELKTRILSVTSFLKEETEIDEMFDNARTELDPQLDRGSFYNSTILWGQDEEIEGIERDLDLEATYALFDQEVTDEVRDKIDKFCLPTFTASLDDYGTPWVIDRYSRRPHMSQVYAKYLNRMIMFSPELASKVEVILYEDNMLFDYQFMWLYAALMASKKVSSKSIKKAVSQLTDNKYTEALRAVCAIFIGKFGDVATKRWLKNYYAQEQSLYVKSAILYSARYFPNAEMDHVYRAWGNHSELNSLIVLALKKQ